MLLKLISKEVARFLHYITELKKSIVTVINLHARYHDSVFIIDLQVKIKKKK